MSEESKQETEDARAVLRKRYEWEVKALTQDVLNKVEMEILGDAASVHSYISNLLQSHPRVKNRLRSAETLMAGGCAGISPRWLEVATFDNELQQMAYKALAMSVYDELIARGVDFGDGE